jgi:hypothetical protein
MRDRWQTAVGLWLLALVIGGFFHECIFRGYTLLPTDMLHQLIQPFSKPGTNVAVQNHYPIDALRQFYPWGLFWRENVAAGRLPLWNPYEFGGLPHLATSVAGTFSPFKLLLLCLSPERAWSLAIVLEFLLAGVFMFIFLRELGRSGFASCLGSCAYALNSAFLMCYWFVPGTFVWVPLALFLFERGTQRNSSSYAAGAGLALSVAFLGGSVQSAFYAGLLCAGYWTLSVLWLEPGRRNAALIRTSLALVVGCLVAAIQWLPTLEFIAQDVSGRVQIGGPQPSLRHTLLGIPLCITFVFPALAGSTESYDLLKVAGATMGDFTAYVGIVPFTLFLIGVIRGRDRRERALLVVMLAVWGAIFFTPLVKYLYHRAFIIIALGMAVIAARGADELLTSPAADARQIRRVFRVMVSMCLLVACGLVIVQWMVDRHRDFLIAAAQNYVLQHSEGSFFGGQSGWLRARVPMFLEHFRLSNVMFWLPILSVCAVAAFWHAYSRQQISLVLFCAVVLGFTVSDLTVLGRHWVPQVNLAEYPLFPSLRVLEPLRQDRELFRVQQLLDREHLLLPDNMLMAYGFSVPGGYESLAPETISSLPHQDETGFNRLLDLQNVKYVLTDQSVILPAERFDLQLEADGARLYRNKHCLPRLQFIPRWEVEHDRQHMLARMTNGQFDPQRLVLIEQEPALVANGRPQPNLDAKIDLIEYTPQRVVARVRCDQAGFLLLSDTFYPGWGARLNGQPATLYRADYILKAVHVPAGESEVEFYYAPRSFRIGAALSIAALLASILFIAGRAAGMIK